MDLTKLTKKNQEFIHIATNQLIQDANLMMNQNDFRRSFTNNC